MPNRRETFWRVSAVVPGLVALAALVGLSPGAPASIIVVDMKSGDKVSSEPATGGRSVGVPVDFEYYARRIAPGTPVEEAVKRALKNLEDTAANESVARGGLRIVLLRPALYTSLDELDPDEHVPETWIADVKARRAVIARTVKSVGRIEVYDYDGGYGVGSVGFIAGTGFVVAPGVLMTNRHVAAEFTDLDAATLPFKEDPRTERPATVYINFAGVHGQNPKLHRIEKVLYAGPKKGPDVALLRFKTDPDKGPPPLPLQRADPKVDVQNRKVLVCGYPTGGNTPGDKKWAEQFMRVLGVKRVSLGQLAGKQHFDGRFRLFHDCTTLGGNSGSPLIDLETGTVWGLHFSGFANGMEGNKAEPLWDVCSIPEIRDTLGPPAAEPEPPATAITKQSVVAEKQVSRPVLLVGKDDVIKPDAVPAEWFRADTEEHRHVRTALPSVGLVGAVEGGDPLATAFMVGKDVAMTIAYQNLVGGDKILGKGSLTDRQLEGRDLAVTFAPDPATGTVKRFRVKKVLYWSPTSYVTLLALEGGADLPPPLALESEKNAPQPAGERAFVVGYTFQDSRIPAEVFNAVFPPPYGNKRVSLGKVNGTAPATKMSAPSEKVFLGGLSGSPDGFSRALALRTVPDLPVRQEKKLPDSQLGQAGDLLHDCSTALGSAGAPLISLKSGRVMGVHYAGAYGKTNAAVPAWNIHGDPEIKRILKDR